MIKPSINEVKQTIKTAKDSIAGKIEDINVEEIVSMAMKLPGAHIDRTVYLNKQLRKYYPEITVANAINTSPATAGIPLTGIETLAKDAIKYETNKVTAISTVAGLPGGLAIVGTIPADTAQYFVFMIRAAQKLAYLYGYPEIEIVDDTLDDAVMNELLIFLGVMLGVQGANVALKALTTIIAQNLPKKLAQKALTKGAIYPIVKSIAKAIGVKMTKEIFAKGVGKAVPVIGGVVSGGLTFATFKPCCYRLQKELGKNFISDSDNGDFSPITPPINQQPSPDHTSD